MKYNDKIINRIFQFIKPEWFFMILSLFNGLVFVIFNSISIWLTASLVNNVLVEFDQLIVIQETLLAKESPTINERLKIIVNNFILRDSNIKTLEVLCISIIIIFILKNIFLYLKNLSMSFVQLRIVTQLRNRLYAHLQILPLSFFQRKKSGDLSSVLMYDVNTLNKSIGTTFQKIIVEPINILAFAILLTIISWKLMIIALLIIPFSQIVMQGIGQSIRRKARRNTKQIGGILSIITENLSSMRIIKSFAVQNQEINRFNEESWKYFSLLFRSSKLRLISSPIIEMIGVSMAVLLLWLGGSKVIVGSSLSSEDFLRFMFLLFSMLGPIRSLSNVHIILQNGFASAERVFDVLDQKTEIVDDGKYDIKQITKKLRFDNVGFNYEENSFNLSNLSFDVLKGQTVAIVGASGAGKSTIADLIPRFFDVVSGKILIDGKNIRQYKIDSLRRMMGIVSQETILMNATISENIAYGADEINEQRLIQAAEGSNAMEFIRGFEDGFNCVIGENGIKLSGGQKQRIAIARAIYKNPSLLLLDEATSSLDSKSEHLVKSALDNLMEKRTVLVIAHRLSTVKNADNIIVLHEGKLVESGTHNELYAKKGYYHQLYDIQFDN